MPWVSEIRPGEKIIGDTDPTPMTPAGMSTGYESRDYSRFPVGYSEHSRAFDMPLIPQSEWDDRIAEMETNKTRLSDLLLQANIPCLDQNGTNYCWINGPVTALETIRCVEGLPYVKLSPASGGAPIKNFSNSGGWGGEALDWIAKNGVCSAALWPPNAISRSYYTSAAKAEALKFRFLEWTDVESNDFNALMTMLFLRIPCPIGLDWWSHVVCCIDPVKISAGQYGVRFRNSWGMSYGDSGFSILSRNKALGDVEAPRVASATNMAA